MGAGVDLTCIVQAVPASSSNEKQEEQTHEVLRVSPVLLCDQDLFSCNSTEISLLLLLHIFSLVGFGFTPIGKRLCRCYGGSN